MMDYRIIENAENTLSDIEEAMDCLDKLYELALRNERNPDYPFSASDFEEWIEAANGARRELDVIIEEAERYEGEMANAEYERERRVV